MKKTNREPMPLAAMSCRPDMPFKPFCAVTLSAHAGAACFDNRNLSYRSTATVTLSANPLLCSRLMVARDAKRPFGDGPPGWPIMRPVATNLTALNQPMRLQIEHVNIFTYDQLISEAYSEM